MAAPEPYYRNCFYIHRRSQRGTTALHKFLEYIVVLCFERRYPKQNSFFRLKSNILVPQIFVLATLLFTSYFLRKVS